MENTSTAWKVFVFILTAIIMALFLWLWMTVDDTAGAAGDVPYPPPDQDCKHAFMKVCIDPGGCSGIFWRPPIDQYACYVWVGANEGREFHFYNDACAGEGVCATWFRPGWPVTVYKLEGAQVEIQQIKLYTRPAKNQWIPLAISGIRQSLSSLPPPGRQLPTPAPTACGPDPKACQPTPTPVTIIIGGEP